MDDRERQAAMRIADYYADRLLGALRRLRAHEPTPPQRVRWTQKAELVRRVQMEIRAARARDELRTRA